MAEGAAVAGVWPAGLVPVVEWLGAAIARGAAAVGRAWVADPACQGVVSHVVGEVVGVRKLVHAAKLLVAAGAAKAVLAAFERFGGWYAEFLERLYPKTWAAMRRQVDLCAPRVLMYLVSDVGEVAMALVMARVLHALGGEALLPARFRSWYHLHSMAHGVLSQRLAYVRGVIVPPFLRHIPLWIGGPCGTFTPADIRALEMNMTAGELAAVEIFPAACKMIVAQLVALTKRLSRWIAGTDIPAASARPRDPPYALWIAALLVLSPLAHVRTALHIPLLHLLPLLMFVDVINGPGGFSWLLCSLYMGYYRSRGVVCATVLPAAFFIVCAYDERRHMREVQEADSDGESYASSTSEGDTWFDPEDPEETGTLVWLRRTGRQELAHLEGVLAAAAKGDVVLRSRGGRQLMAPTDAASVLRQLRVLRVHALPTTATLGDNAAQLVRSVVVVYMWLTSDVYKVVSTDQQASLGGQQGERCSVCQGGYDVGSMACKTHCGHLFHNDCVVDWLVRKRQCPLCRTSLLGDGFGTSLRRHAVAVDEARAGRGGPATASGE